jgi:hypothetical protein
MNKIVKKYRERRDLVALERAIERAATPSMRNELIALASRYPLS